MIYGARNMQFNDSAIIWFKGKTKEFVLAYIREAEKKTGHKHRLEKKI